MRKLENDKYIEMAKTGLIGFLVALALIITREPICLWGMIALVFAM